MFEITFVPIPTEKVRAYQSGEPDANGQIPEKYLSDGDGVPCRHCLKGVAKGEGYLLLAHRPFSGPQPFAEVGPIFLHQEPCEAYTASPEIPPMLAREQYLVRGYDSSERIVYGSGQVVKTECLREQVAGLFANPKVAFVHVRSSTNNCFHCRIDRR